MQTFKGFIFIYAVFTILLTLLGLNSGAQYMDLTIPVTINLVTIAQFVYSLVGFAFSVIFYTTGYFIIDGILWAMRIVSAIELVYFAKTLINPASN